MDTFKPDGASLQYLKQAEYVDGRKVAGVRSLSPAIAAVNTLKEHFGKRQLRGITHANIRAFRAERLAKPTKAKKQRSVVAVNRELEKMRRLLNVAEREGWILRNPMRGGDPLISIADERKRERILTRDEELRLLAACANRYQKYLRPILICARSIQACDAARSLASSGATLISKSES